MRRLSSNFFAGTRCHSFGDITYLPTSSISYSNVPARGTWLREVVPDWALEPGVPAGVLAEVLGGAFAHALLRDGKEPAWIRRINKPYRAHFRRSYAIQECDLLFAVPHVPLLGLGYIIEDGGFTREACDVFGLWRLQNIAQLGKLHDPIIADMGTRGYGRTFRHNRLVHSLDARAIGLCMATNNRLGDLARRTLEVAGLSHDARTPAYGDGTKALDAKFFDEDLHYPEPLRGPRWERFRGRYGLNEEFLVDTVQGKGVPGTLLDIADKLSYLAGDVQAYLVRYAPNGSIVYPQGYEEIKRLTAKHPHLFALWETVWVRGGDVIFKDPRWLMDFLRARMLMFKLLYFHPGSRYLERITSVIFVRHLLEAGLLSKQHLLTLDDQGLDEIIRHHFGQDAAPYLIGSDGIMPRVEIFESSEAASRREQELLHEGVALTFLDAHAHPNPALHFLVRSRGKTLSFKEAFPRAAEKIEAIARSVPVVKLYYLAIRPEHLPPAFRKISETFRAARLAANIST